MKKEISISEIGEYSLEELSSSIYSNPIYKTKISNLSRWDILNIFRERSFNDICLKILTIELEKSKIEPLTKETFDNWKFKNELIRELLIFPSSKRRIRVVKSDPSSHKRIISFIQKFKYIIKNEIPECLVKEFEKIVPEEINWDLEDDAFVRECIGQDTASHYNGASGILFTLKKRNESWCQNN